MLLLTAAPPAACGDNACGVGHAPGAVVKYTERERALPWLAQVSVTDFGHGASGWKDWRRDDTRVVSCVFTACSG